MRQIMVVVKDGNWWGFVGKRLGIVTAVTIDSVEAVDCGY